MNKPKIKNIIRRVILETYEEDIPTFFKRRFDKDLFEDYLDASMNYWVSASFGDFYSFEINTINDTIDNYFSDNYKVSARGDVKLSEYYKFVDYVIEKYGKKIKDFWEQYHN